MSERPKEAVPRGDHVPGDPNDISAKVLNKNAETDSEPAPAPDAGVRGREEKEDPSLGG